MSRRWLLSLMGALVVYISGIYWGGHTQNVPGLVFISIMIWGVGLAALGYALGRRR